MKLKVNFSSNQVNLNVSGKDLDSQSVKDIIDLASRAMNVALTEAPVVQTSPIKETKPTNPIAVATPQSSKVKSVATPVKDSKITPLVKNEGELVFATKSDDESVSPFGVLKEVVSVDNTDETLTIEQRIAELNKNTQETGIKHKVYAGVITPMYRTDWSCPKCKSKGRHYLLPEIKKTKCYDCQQTLLVTPAAPGTLSRNEDGAFFIADRPFPAHQKL